MLEVWASDQVSYKIFFLRHCLFLHTSEGVLCLLFQLDQNLHFLLNIEPYSQVIMKLLDREVGRIDPAFHPLMHQLPFLCMRKQPFCMRLFLA